MAILSPGVRDGSPGRLGRGLRMPHAAAECSPRIRTCQALKPLLLTMESLCLPENKCSGSLYSKEI